ncbi:hypothetical protein GE09DRAFT_1279564 [Coniochaeta sp. 2T2.1]|nr:hypothetical protein GE09DRAFT_1279564 [Coniochaeta sp. 2T2.1]
MAEVPLPPTSPAEARRHIEAIRRDNGLDLDGATGLKGQFQKLLQLVGEQLYQDSTHFLLELIQNADDNSYTPDTTPTVTFFLGDKYLRVDCNETGFQPNHVQALCSVAMSTKAVPGKGSQFVGEKGLGFKSVFKVADVVWVCSGFYTFKLDKRSELGMIAPVWDDFPATKKPGYTSFYLQLSPSCNMQELVEDLSKLDGRSLIFLRRLTNIEITIRRKKKRVEVVLRKETKSTLLPYLVVTTLHRNSESQVFIVYKNMMKMPKHEKRVGSTQSEVCLAFPLNAGLKPQIGPQSVYAFLPIRSYGFSLLLHGDFILTANRQDIEIANTWNDTIIAEQTKSIVEMFTHFARGSSALQYTWVRFIPYDDGAWSMFNSKKGAIRDKLRELPLFEGETSDDKQGRSLSGLGSLRYVPSIYRDEDGSPLTSCKMTAPGYLSRRYADEDVEILKKLNMKLMDFNVFLKDLETCVTRFPKAFQSRPLRYHSSLAKVLLRHVHEAPYRDRIRALPIIWVRGGEDGEWVAASRGKVFFPGDSKSKTVPEGVKATIVTSEHASDPPIKLLYVALGVGELSNAEICQLIIDTHTDQLIIRRRPIQSDQLVSHAIYLFESNYQDKDKASQLWVYAEDESVTMACNAYIDLDIDYPVRFYLPSRNAVAFLHGTYFSAVEGRAPEFCQWLQSCMGVSAIPRLASPTSTGGFEMTSEFKYILKESPSVDMLYLLKENWRDSYSAWFHPDLETEPSKRQSMEKLKQAISHSQVDCMRHKRVPMFQSFMPLREWLSYASQIPLLNIPLDEPKAWDFLKLFGVGVKRNVRFFLDILRRLPWEPVTESTFSQVSSLYDNIQKLTKDDTDAVCDFFKEKAVIFIPGIGTAAPAWLPLKSCTWDGPELRHFKSIKSMYPQNETLFCTILQLKDLEIEHLLHEMHHLRPDEDLGYLRYLFDLLNEYNLRAKGGLREKEARQLAPLTRQKVFPVLKTGRGNDKGYTSLENAMAGSAWFISDRQEFDRSFEGKAPLLAFDWETNEKFKRLYETMGFKDRTLSTSARTSPVIGGPRIYNDGYTKMLRSKVDFMIRLIPEKCEDRKNIAASLRNLQVHSVRSLKRRWCVSSAGVDIFGDAMDTKCLFEPQGDALFIFLLDAHLHSSHFQFHHNLAKLLADYCHAEEHLKYLMNPVITERNHGVVNSMFADEGVRNLTADEERDKRVSYFQNIDSSADGGSEGGGKTGDGNHPAVVSSDSAVPSSSSSNPAAAASKALKVIAEGHVLPKKIRIYDARGQQRNKDVKKEKGKRRAAKGSRAFNPNDSDTGTLEFNLVSESSGSDSDSDDDDSGYGEGSANGESGVFAAFIEKGSKALRKKKKEPAEAQPGFDKDLAAAGEYFISRLLTTTLPNFYSPTQHWTSPFREIAGIAPVEPADLGGCASSFTIPDQYGAFTKFLASTGLSECSAWLEHPPIYHIEVVTTQKDLHSSFYMRKGWWRMARRHSGGKTKEQRRRRGNVCLLIRVFNWSRSPEVVFYPDPWNHFMTGKLKLEPESMYKGRIRQTGDD